MPFDIRQGIIDTAAAIGMPAHDLATIISFESGFNGDVWGGKNGQHYGFIQFGPAERAQYGVRVGDPSSQLGPNGAVAKYFIDRGYKPGMGIMDAYSIVNAGGPGLYNRSDTAAGGTPGDVRAKVTTQFAPHAERATALLGGSYTPSYTNTYASATPTQTQYADPTMALGGGTVPIDFDDSFSSPLADALAPRVSDQGDAGGVGTLKRKPKADLPTFDFASATPEAAPPEDQEPTLAAPTSIPNKTLADLFQVADIGGADKRNALPTVDYGYQQAPQRRRREA